MSNDVRNLLHDAASTPSTEPDVRGAWRRGRRLRVQRRALSGLAAVAIVGLGSLAIASVSGNGNRTTPITSITTPIAPSCATPSRADDIPSWAKSARVPYAVPHVLSPDGNVLAVLFGYPLHTGVPTDRQNKILWVMRQPRDGRPLGVTMSLPGYDVITTASYPAGSAPGEIYPSTINRNEPGCWHFALSWGKGHRASIDLRYSTPPPETTTTTSSATVPATTGPGPCSTADLTITLGAPNGTAGHINYEIAFLNHSSSTCTLAGFPGVSFLDASGAQTGAPADRNPIAYTPVILAPGATAYAHLAKNDLGNPPCSAAAHALRVYPPNETAYVDIPIDAGAVCGSSTIDPVLDHPLG